MISKLKSPIYVQIEVTSECNLRCSHCYNFWRYNSAPKRESLSLPELKKVAEVLGEHDIFYVTITGGEPFLEKDRVYGFLEFLREQNIRVTVNSNATLITDDDARKLSEYSIEVFLVSLMSSSAEKHNAIAGSKSAFSRAIQGIQTLQKHGINVAVNTVATKINHGDIYTTGKWVYDNFGIKNYSATPICPSVPEHESLVLNEKEVFVVLHQLLSLQKELGMNVDLLEVLPTCLFSDSQDENIVKIFAKRMCTAGNTTITIGSQGDVRVCSYDQESYGNILAEDFQSIWRRMEKWRDNSLLPHECESCAIVESCGGGCRVNSNLRTGQYCELDYLSRGKIEKERALFFENIANVPMGSYFSLSDSVFVREEKDGIFVVVANSAYFMIVNSASLEIIKYLGGLGSFIPTEILTSLGLDQKVGEKFFAELFNKGFFNATGKDIDRTERVHLKRREEVITHGKATF